MEPPNNTLNSMQSMAMRDLDRGIRDNGMGFWLALQACIYSFVQNSFVNIPRQDWTSGRTVQFPVVNQDGTMTEREVAVVKVIER